MIRRILDAADPVKRLAGNRWRAVVWNRLREPRGWNGTGRRLRIGYCAFSTVSGFGALRMAGCGRPSFGSAASSEGVRPILFLASLETPLATSQEMNSGDALE